MSSRHYQLSIFSILPPPLTAIVIIFVIIYSGYCVSAGEKICHSLHQARRYSILLPYNFRGALSRYLLSFQVTHNDWIDYLSALG